MSFDTTSSNTGLNSGACALIEKKIGRELLWLACRHHVYELTVSIAYKTALKEVSAGPGIALFERFKKQWGKINKISFESGLANPMVSDCITSSEKNDIISFVTLQLNIIGKSGKKDYAEVLELTLLFLG